jgi:hypothetical protein
MKKIFFSLIIIFTFVLGCGAGAYVLERFYKNLIYDLAATRISESLMTYKPALDYLVQDKASCAKFIIASQMKMEVEISAKNILENTQGRKSHENLQKLVEESEQYLRKYDYFSLEKSKCST